MLNFELLYTVNATWRGRQNNTTSTILIHLEGMPNAARLDDICRALGSARPSVLTLAQAEEIARVLNVAASEMGGFIPAPDLLATCTWKSLHTAITNHRDSGRGGELRAVHTAIRRWRHTNALWTVIDAVDAHLKVRAHAA